MRAAMAAIAAAEAGSGNLRAAAAAQPLHDAAFATLDESARRYNLAGGGQRIHAPMEHLRWPRVAAKAGADAARSVGAAAIDIEPRLQGSTPPAAPVQGEPERPTGPPARRRPANPPYRLCAGPSFTNTRRLPIGNQLNANIGSLKEGRAFVLLNERDVS